KLTDNRDAPARFRGYQREHQSLGWPDIAYHLLIDRHGNIYKGRHTWAVGDTCTSYDPTGHLLIMCEGNMSEQDVSIRQMRGLVEVVTWATAHFDVPLRRIKGHRDYAATDCPGANLYRRIEDGTIKRHVTHRLKEGGARMKRLCGDEGARRVRQIENGTD
ncbi:MAG: peptidoglycan recognition protein family protein, partial [Actinobacteria bacterium]|nr:peptidoglycan recognition protein family protein [Actinomycetota bacterium]